MALVLGFSYILLPAMSDSEPEALTPDSVYVADGVGAATRTRRDAARARGPATRARSPATRARRAATRMRRAAARARTTATSARRTATRSRRTETRARKAAPRARWCRLSQKMITTRVVARIWSLWNHGGSI